MTSVDPLLNLLPSSADSQRPWLVWYAPHERVEFTGHVLSMWMCKIAGLLASEAAPQPSVHVGMPTSWRSLTWALGTWWAGGQVWLSELAPSPESQPLFRTPPQVSVGFCVQQLHPQAEVEVLVPSQALATSWTQTSGTSLPALALDGVADVMTYADTFPPAPAAADQLALLAPQIKKPALALSRSALAARATVRANTERACLIQTAGASALIEVLTAWHQQRAAVLLSPDADAALRASAQRQENALPL